MYQSVITFWFEKIEPSQWFAKDSQFDQHIAERFGSLYQQAVQCELFQWRNEAKGRLAEIIILDQFSRNIFRDSSRAFAHDSLALALAQEAVSLQIDQALTDKEKSFLYMPYMHSESKAIHKIAERLFAQPGLESNYRFELKHKEIIDQFGRYPHRNALLGRESTTAEIEFLAGPGSSF